MERRPPSGCSDSRSSPQRPILGVSFRLTHKEEGQLVLHPLSTWTTPAVPPPSTTPSPSIAATASKRPRPPTRASSHGNRATPKPRHSSALRWCNRAPPKRASTRSRARSSCTRGTRRSSTTSASRTRRRSDSRTRRSRTRVPWRRIRGRGSALERAGRCPSVAGPMLGRGDRLLPQSGRAGARGRRGLERPGCCFGAIRGPRRGRSRLPQRRGCCRGRRARARGDQPRGDRGEGGCNQPRPGQGDARRALAAGAGGPGQSRPLDDVHGDVQVRRRARRGDRRAPHARLAGLPAPRRRRPPPARAGEPLHPARPCADGPPPGGKPPTGEKRPWTRC